MRHWLLLPLLLSLMACGPSPQQQRPERTAMRFFQALYVDEDVATAQSLVAPHLAELMAHYRLPSQIQRNLFGLRMTEVSLDITEINIDFFRRNSDGVEVLVQLAGYRGDQYLVEDRRVKLERIDNRWLISEFFDDPFNSGG